MSVSRNTQIMFQSIPMVHMRCILGVVVTMSIALGLSAARAKAQKPVLDTSSFRQWSWVNGSVLSPDGAYAGYTIYDQPTGHNTFVIQALRTEWKREIPDVGNVVITQDSRTALFLTPTDSLCQMKLGTSVVTCLPNVRSFRLVPQDSHEMLVYQLKDSAKSLVIRNMATGREQSFAHVTNFMFSNDRHTLLLLTESKTESGQQQSVQWIQLPSGTMTTVWQGKGAEGFVFDSSSRHLAFTVQSEGKAGGNGPPEKSLWYYKFGTPRAQRLVMQPSSNVASGLHLESVSRFSSDGRQLFVTLKEESYPQPRPDAVKVDVWSYTDQVLQPQQLKNLVPQFFGGGPRSYAAVLHLNDSLKDFRLVQLERENERIMAENADVVLVEQRVGASAERHWNSAVRPSLFVVSSTTGERKPLAGVAAPMQSGGKFLLVENHDIYAYEVATGILRNLTQSLPIPAVDEQYDFSPGPKPRMVFSAAWLKNEHSVLIYDKYDIWQIDPAGKRPAINLTNGYGRRHGIVFRLALDDRSTSIANNVSLLISAFDRTTKQSGFYRIVVGRARDPELLTMGPFKYGTLLKARDAERYVVSRENASQSPNYFATSDFNTFTQLSHVAPEAAYNWLTAELLTSETADGRAMQTVVYKPENFDANKRYPVIFYYYEKMSDNLHEFSRPQASPGWLNIPWFVSCGYVVVTPDIAYTMGEPGPSAYNSVMSAARTMTRFPWVDSTRMGIQGHSFGGYETNYIVTQTPMFAAAVSAAGPTDLVSGYGATIPGSGASAQYFFEVHQLRIGATLWQRPDLYIKNSPIFHADRITTPLLIIHNQEDGAVPFAQGVELFTALRRLGKRAWMLQYDGQRHSFSDDKAATDYTIRMTQFFDHYLKGAPAPRWMTRGIPAKLKGIDDGLQLDSTITTPGPGLL